MISYVVYKWIHFAGLFLVFIALGGLLVHAQNQNAVRPHPARHFVSISHGIGLFLILLGGFGMMARLGIVTEIPGWVWAKLGIWGFLGGVIALLYRKPKLVAVWRVLICVAVFLAFYLVLAKPF